MSRINDASAMLKSLIRIVEAGLIIQRKEALRKWNNSSLRTVVTDIPTKAKKNSDDFINSDPFGKLNDSAERVSTVFLGLTEFTKFNCKNVLVKQNTQSKSLPKSRQQKSYSKKASSKPEPKVNPKPFDIKLTKSDTELLKKLDREHRERIAREENKMQEDKRIKDEEPTRNNSKKEEVTTQEDELPKITAVPNPKSKQSLNTCAKQRTVPSSRLGRMFSFGGLAASLGLGTLSEYTKRTLGVSEAIDSNIFMNKANMDRIVDTLCKVRGAALKIGQILSIQDESVVNPELAKALERVRKSADFMPNWQLEKVLISELGLNWRDNFDEFNIVPFAAASIGQVHWAKLHDGTEVAIKIQYPGVAKGIESDIDNLVTIMKMWNIFPPGMFVDNVVTVAKRELAWEVDYIREAACTRTFKELLEPYPYYHVPAVIDDLSTKQVFTTELVEGIPVDQCIDLSLEERKFIGSTILELVLREVMEFRYMQTDPNWANFFYNKNTRQLVLLDFGATREYSKKFTDHYVKIIKAASEGDRNTILTYSRELGFFTGYESKIMEEAHVDAVMILGEVFRSEKEFDFSNQNTSERIQQLVPTMLAHRLCPPPEEIYSLHRKISGVFLLCAKLKVPINARKIFLELFNKYHYEY